MKKFLKNNRVLLLNIAARLSVETENEDCHFTVTVKFDDKEKVKFAFLKDSGEVKDYDNL